MADEDKTVLGELDLTGPGGVGAKMKGFRIMDVICLFSAVAVGYCAMTLYNHNAEAKDNSKEVASALRESNKEVANALKDTTRDTTEAMKAIAAEQRRMTEAIKEGNCLLDPAMRARPDAREICKRLNR